MQRTLNYVKYSKYIQKYATVNKKYEEKKEKNVLGIQKYAQICKSIQ